MESGTVEVDDVVNANNIFIAVGSFPNIYPGKHGNALWFNNAANQLMGSTNGAYTPSSNGAALSFWHGTSFPSGGYQTYAGAGNGLFVTVNYNFNGTTSLAASVQQSNLFSVSAIWSNPSSYLQYNHVLAIAADGVVELYWNGALVATNTFDGTFASMTQFVCGNEPWGAGSGNLILDEIAFWKNIDFGSAAKRAEFAAALHNNGNGRFYSGGSWG